MFRFLGNYHDFCFTKGKKEWLMLLSTMRVGAFNLQRQDLFVWPVRFWSRPSLVIMITKIFQNTRIMVIDWNSRATSNENRPPHLIISWSRTCRGTNTSDPLSLCRSLELLKTLKLYTSLRQCIFNYTMFYYPNALLYHWSWLSICIIISQILLWWPGHLQTRWCILLHHLL